MGIVGDTKLANIGIRRFVEKQGWHPVAITTLDSNYGHDGLPDIVYGKRLVTPEEWEYNSEQRLYQRKSS